MGTTRIDAPDGLPFAAVHDVATGSLVALKCEDRACSQITRTTVDSGGVGFDPSVGLQGGLPVIAYYDTGNSALKLALCNNARCQGATLRTATREHAVQLEQATHRLEHVPQLRLHLGIVFANGLPDLRIGQACMRAHDRAIELRAADVAVAVDAHLADHAQPVDLRSQ